MQETVKFMDVVGGVAALGEEGVDDEAAGSALHDHLCLRLDGSGIVGAERDVKVENCAFMFVAEEREQVEWAGGVV